MVEKHDQKTRVKFATFDIKSYLRNDGRYQTYYAYDEAFGQDVVVKVYPPDFFADAEFRQRFEQEIQALVLEDVPGVVPVHDLVQVGDRRYLVRDYLPGDSLEKKILNGPMNIEEVVDIISQLATAIDLLHERGLFHRNIKPANVLFDEGGNPFLSDVDQAPPYHPTDEKSVYTPLPDLHSYAPPEMALGQELDWRADIYGLGALTFAMLAGREPYMGSELEQLALKLISPPPSILDFRPELSKDVAAAISWAMAKSPTQRYDSASDFAAAFAAAAGLPWQADAPLKPEETVVRERTPWGFRLGILMVILLLIGGGGIGYYQGIFNLERGIDNVLGYFVVPTNTPSETPLPTHTATPTFLPTPSPSLTPSEAPTLTPTQPSPTNTPGPTPTPTPLVGSLVLGMADKIAVINDREIWVANVDGSNVEQWTFDGRKKSDLQWTPDGRNLLFRVDNCYDVITYPGKERRQLGCFGDIGIAPDNVRVAVSSLLELTNITYRWVTFISSLNLVLTNQIVQVPILPEKVGCPFSGGRQMRFSRDGKYMAGIFVTTDGDKIDVFKTLFEAGQCGGLQENEIDREDFIDADRVKLKYYYGNQGRRTLTDFAWDGESVFILHGYYLWTGYGEFVVFYSRIGDPTGNDPRSGRYEVKIPITRCCYRDMEFSPDGKYVVFSYMLDEKLDKVELYYIPFNQIGTGATFSPIQFSDSTGSIKEFFNDIKEWPEPALRPAIP